MSLCYFSIQRSDNGKTDDVWEFDETYRGLCHEESLHFIAYAYIRTIKRQREFVQQELLISGIFLLVFCCLSVFYYPVKTGYVTANLTDSFCSNNAFVSGNHSSCVVALEPLAKSKSRTA